MPTRAATSSGVSVSSMEPRADFPEDASYSRIHRAGTGPRPTSALGAGQVSVVSPSQQGAWLAPRSGQRSFTQAPWPCTYWRVARQREQCIKGERSSRQPAADADGEDFLPTRDTPRRSW